MHLYRYQLTILTVDMHSSAMYAMMSFSREEWKLPSRLFIYLYYTLGLVRPLVPINNCILINCILYWEYSFWEILLIHYKVINLTTFLWKTEILCSTILGFETVKDLKENFPKFRKYWIFDEHSSVVVSIDWCNQRKTSRYGEWNKF